MSCKDKNIYKLAREMSGLTQEDAIEGLKDKISIRTLQRYENGECIPKSLIVKEMIKIYGTTWLGYMHLKQSDDIGVMVLPQLNLDDLSINVLRFQKEYKDIEKIKDSMVEIACDGEISESEENGWRFVTKEIDELISASLSLMFMESKKPSKLALRGL